MLDPGFEGEPDFTDDIGTTDSEEAAARRSPTSRRPIRWSARPTDAEELAVVGGFDATSMDDEERRAEFDDRNDDDISLATSCANCGRTR